MNILGLSTFADSSAAIVSDGQIVCCVEEERLKRIKHYEGMPWLAIDECLQIANMTLKDIDVIAIGWNPYLGWKARIAETIRSLSYAPGAFAGKLDRGHGYIKGCGDIFGLKRSLAKRYSSYEVRPKIIFVPHHLAHAASSFYVSPYDAANIIVADGVGESATISFFSGGDGQISPIAQISLPHSLGHLYASVTGFLGFKMTCDEGKIMGLAAFGEDRYRGLFMEMVQVDRFRKTIKINTKMLDYHAARQGHFPKEWIRRSGMKPRRWDEPLTPSHRDLACSLQKCIEDAIIALLEMFFGKCNPVPLCGAGGLFLNSVLNGKIIRELNPNFFLQPAAGDNGVSLGAALHVCATKEPIYLKRPLSDVFLGPEYSDHAIRKTLLRRSIIPQTSDAAHAKAVEFITQGKIIGWFRGRMEYGPRALGNRSILADPTKGEIKNIVNQKIKHREPFRPFAGSVMVEEGREYFESFQESPYMLMVFYFREKYREIFPAICHYDHSCRVQTVAQDQDLHRLLIEMKKITGHGMVLNTSMNLAGEPIVNTPDEAVDVLKNSELDALILGDYIITKEDAVALH